MMMSSWNVFMLSLIHICNGSTADSDSVSRGSNPFSVVTKNGVWLSLVERYVRDVEVACSNHVTPIFNWNIV